MGLVIFALWETQSSAWISRALTLEGCCQHQLGACNWPDRQQKKWGDAARSSYLRNKHASFNEWQQCRAIHIRLLCNNIVQLAYGQGAGPPQQIRLRSVGTNGAMETVLDGAAELHTHAAAASAMSDTLSTRVRTRHPHRAGAPGVPCQFLPL